MPELLLQAHCLQGPWAWPWRWIYGDTSKALMIHVMANAWKDLSLRFIFSKLLSTVTYPRCSQRSLLCFKVIFLCLTWVLPLVALRTLLSWHCGTDPSYSLYMTLSGFRVISQGPSHSSLKHFVLLLRKHFRIYVSGFSAQKHTGHFEKCMNACTGIYLAWTTIHDCNRHPPWRDAIEISLLSHFSLAIWDQNEVALVCQLPWEHPENENC